MMMETPRHREFISAVETRCRCPYFVGWRNSPDYKLEKGGENHSSKGKSKISDYLFLYEPLLYAYQNRDKVRVKVKYFTLEMSKEECFTNFLSFVLYHMTEHTLRKSPMNLRSVNHKYPLDSKTLELLQSAEYKDLFNFFEQSVEYIDSIRTPEGIYNNCRSYCEKNGTIVKKKTTEIDEFTKVEVTKEVDDHYVPNDPDEYFIIIIDNASLISTQGYKDIREAIFDLSSNYLLRLRNIFNAIPVLIQQQGTAQEGVENLKLNLTKPTVNGLGECKTTARDCNYALGIYSPYRHTIKEYERYDITRWRDNIRFLEVIANRHGGAGMICPLLFLGDVGYFEELPLPHEIKESDYQKTEYKPLVSTIANNKLFFIKRLNELFQNPNSFCPWKG